MTALLRAAALAAPQRGRLALSIVAGAGAVAAAIGLLATSGYLIVRAAERPPVLELTVAVVAVRAFGISRAALRYAERLVSHDLAFRVLADLRRRFYRRLAPLVPAGLPGLRTGDLLSRFVADVDQLQHLYLRALAPPIVAVAVLALSAGVGFAILPAAGLVLAAALLVAAVAVPVVTDRAARSAARRQAPARAALTDELVEALDGAAELAVLGQDGERLRRVRTADARLAGLARRDALVGGLASALGTLLCGLAVVAVVAVTVPAVHDGRLPGVLLGLLALLALAAFEGVAPLPAAARQMAACAASAARLQEIVETPAPTPDPAAPRPLPAGPVALEAHAVRLAFDPTGPAVLDGVDLRLAPGRTTALVGPSGCGKTTLAELLVRFRDPDAGHVTLGGIDLRELAQDDVRRTVLLAAHDAHLFTTTIRANLLLARRDATDTELLAALHAVGLSAFVAELPEGLDTPVGEDGAQLSGGQRRRLLVARALVSDAGTLVLDEPAAHLDPAGVRAMHERLRREARRRAILVISHHTAGLDDFDEINVMEAGRIVERGSPAELLRRGGRYARARTAQGGGRAMGP